MFKHTPCQVAFLISSAIFLVISSLSSCSVLVHAQTGTNFVVPCTINTYGPAWAGSLTFGLLQMGQNSGSYLIVMNTNGQLQNMRKSDGMDYWAVNPTGQNTLMFQGEPTYMNAVPECPTHFWNYATNSTQDFLNVIGHHEVEYNPISNTFLTLQDYMKQVGGNTILYDKIVKMSADGDVLWTWDTADYIPLSQADSINSTARFYGQTVIDLTHANALDWDYNHGVIYLNLRHTDTFYKINETNGNLIWSCGKFGNFTLLNAQGRNVSSLWYHSHDTQQISPNVFIMFDNDYNNVTNPNNCHSRLLQITVDETSMTARETFSWEAPKSYWSTVWGSVSVLPNGDFFGCFGPNSHQSPQNRPWDFSNTGAILVEVNPQGQLVRTWTFPVGWGIYRAKPITPPLIMLPEYSSTDILLVGMLLITVMVAVVKIQFNRRETKTNRHLSPRMQCKRC